MPVEAALALITSKFAAAFRDRDRIRFRGRLSSPLAALVIVAALATAGCQPGVGPSGGGGASNSGSGSSTTPNGDDTADATSNDADSGDSSGGEKSQTASNSPAAPSDAELREMLDRALDFTCQGRRLNLTDHAAWQIVHGALAFGRDFQITNNQGEDVSAIDYLLAGGEMTGWLMKEGVPLGNPPRPGLRAIVEAGSKTGQGHADQWLGYLADIGLKLDQEIKAGGRTYTLEDYLNQIEYDVPVNVDQEYSWTLMALTAYRPTDYEWTAGDGNKWSIARLMEIEVNHDLAVSACGGSHRMAGIVMALTQHRKQGRAVEGPWAAADEKIRKCVADAKRFQNPDGSLSTNWFQRPGASPDIKERLGCTGHVLEFCILASSDDELKQPWMRRSVAYLCRLLEKTKQLDLECGALYHAAHGLVLYRQRMFGPKSYVGAE